MDGARMSLLTREQVRAAIHRQGPPRPPRADVLSCEPELLEMHGDRLRTLMQRYPDDVVSTNITVWYWEAPEDDPDYRWAFGGKQKPAGQAIDDCPVIEDWSELDQFLAEFPTAYRDEPFERIRKLRAENPERYLLVSFGHYFNQKMATMRGIKNLLLDLHDHQRELRMVMDAWLEFYRVWCVRTAQAGADGVYGGDDLGTQRSLFMSPQTFRLLYQPYYRTLADSLHENGLDFWLHTCGNVTKIMPDLIESGIDVLHPIQEGTMCAEQIAAEYGRKIAFYVGMDVQNLIPFGTVEQVRAGIRRRAEIFYRREGGVIYGAGNVILRDTPLTNMEAYAKTLSDFCREQQLGPDCSAADGHGTTE